MNHTVVFEFIKHAVHRGLVDLIVQDVKQHACRKRIVRLAKSMEHLLKVFGFSDHAHEPKLTQLGCNSVLHP